MFNQKKKPYELLTTVGSYYEVTVREDYDGKTSVISGEFRGWYYDENQDFLYAVIWKMGDSRAYDYYSGDILAVSPMEKPLNKEDLFFSPYKDRTVEIGQKVDIYRNLHTNNGYSIRCSKTGLVLAHCSTVRLKNAKFLVSENGRQKTIKEKRKRVHAYVRGELVAYNEEFPQTFSKVLYNPYYTKFFTDAATNAPIKEADEVFCSGKFAYAKNPIFG